MAPSDSGGLGLRGVDGFGSLGFRVFKVYSL